MALSAQIALSVVAHETDTADLARALRVTSGSYSVAMGDGTGAGQAQIAWSDSRSVGTVAETLTTSSLSDTRDGAAVTVAFAAIKAMYIKNTHATNSLAVTSMLVAGVPPATAGHTHFVQPGGVLFMCAPDASGKAATSVLALGTGAGTTYDIILIGEGTVT